MSAATVTAVNCRTCKKPFEPASYLLRKTDYLCLNCRRSYNAAWRERRRAAGLTASGTRTWAPEKRAVFLERQRQREEVKQRDRRAQARIRNDPNFRSRIRARMEVRNAIRRGEMRRPDACQDCGRTDLKVCAHHEDYSKPLEVQWLCRPCHSKADVRLRRAEGRAGA
jgi:hypothetical protein